MWILCRCCRNNISTTETQRHRDTEEPGKDQEQDHSQRPQPRAAAPDYFWRVNWSQASRAEPPTKGAGISVSTNISTAKAASRRRLPSRGECSGTCGCRDPMINRKMAHISHPCQKKM